MHYFKRLVSGIAVGALIAFAAPASATTLTSPAGTQLGSGITMHLKEKKGKWKIIVQSTEEVFTECNRFTLHMESTNAGSSTETIDFDVTKFKQEECTIPVITLNKGTFEVHTALFFSNGNATITWKGQEVTLKPGPFFGSCVYGTGSGVDMGTLLGGAPAVVNLQSTLVRVGGDFACPEQVTVTAEYEVTSPNPLFVD